MSKRQPDISLIEVETSQFDTLGISWWKQYDGCHSIRNKQQVDRDSRKYLRQIRISGLIRTI